MVETEWYYMNSNYIEQKKNTHLYFQIGENKYAINTSNVLEIMKLPALDYPQKLPNNIIGLLKYNNFSYAYHLIANMQLPITFQKLHHFVRLAKVF